MITYPGKDDHLDFWAVLSEIYSENENNCKEISTPLRIFIFSNKICIMTRSDFYVIKPINVLISVEIKIFSTREKNTSIKQRKKLGTVKFNWKYQSKLMIS